MSEEYEIKTAALREFEVFTRNINTVLYTDLDRGRHVRIRDLINDFISERYTPDSVA